MANRGTIGAIAAGFLLLLMSGGRASAKGKTLPPPPDCALGPFEVEASLVAEAIADALTAGMRSTETIAIWVAEDLWPDRPDNGATLSWPATASSPEDQQCAWDFLLDHVENFLDSQGYPPFPACPPGTDLDNDQCVGPTPFDVLDELISPTPRPGFFYQIGSRPDVPAGKDTFSKIRRDALNSVVPGAGDNADNRIDYGHCITSGPQWNWPLYASSKPAGSGWGSWEYVNGQSLRRAWMPWNDDAVQAVAEGHFPERLITQGGDKISGGNRWGLIWLPPVDADQLVAGVITCDSVVWSDGSSSIDPPPELLLLLVA